MITMKETVLGIPVCSLTYEQLTERIFQDMEKNKKTWIVAINPEKIMKAQEDDTLRDLLQRATYPIPDGIGVVIASILKGGRIRQRVTGIDLMLRLCEAAAKNEKKVFLYGAKPGVVEEAKKNLERKYPGLNIVGVMNGYEKNEQAVIEAINSSNADILFVALGSPAQEKWIVQHMNVLVPKVYQGVGGSFDVASGNLKRAPLFMQKLGLEWLYRLIKEPWRWRRQLILPKFLIKVIKE